ncbi:MAG: class I SAM-dependent methyltransferase [bacterium]|nr:class I SAM-dependent methyltransferase [bacterium]
MENTIFIKKPLEIKDNIPLFSVDKYWGKSPESVLLSGLKIIDEQGWKEFNRYYAGKLDFTDDQSRADWRFNVPVDKNFMVLDTGAGMGRITLPLAKVVKRVVAFDASLSRMQFLQRRLKEEGLNNVDLLVADFFDLPLADASFDLIVMNGVLEWVGKTNFFKDPQAAQLASLKICLRLLKPGGYLYIGIENRWALSYLRGFDHSGLRYTGYMPRFLASWYCQLRGRGKYDTYTYSRSGYEKLITQAGFTKENIQFFLPYPGYNVPRIVVPYGNLNILQYLIVYLMSARGQKRKLIQFLARFDIFLWLYRLLFFSFNIIIKK